MQLVTNIYLPDDIGPHHNLRYKIVQAKLATELEDKEGKNWILTQYLNDVPYGTMYGQTAIGVAAASQMFFDKPVAKLDLAQIALLAGLPQAPSEYNPFCTRRARTGRRGQVLQAMLTSGYITRAQEQAANAEGLQVTANDIYGDVRQPYVVDYVKQQLVQDPRPADGRPRRAQGLHDDQPRRSGVRGRGDPGRRGPAPATRPRRWSRSTPTTATSWRCRTRPRTAPARARRPSTTPPRPSARPARRSSRSC